MAARVTTTWENEDLMKDTQSRLTFNELLCAMSRAIRTDGRLLDLDLLNDVTIRAAIN